jgi:hypothetical protein
MTDSFNPLLHNLQPVNFRTGEHVPEAWDPSGPDSQPRSRLTVVLPGEIATAVVLKVVSSNAVVAQLGPLMCTGRGHSYRPKDIVPVRRENDAIGGERWSVVSDRELQQNETIGRFIEIEKALAYPAPKEIDFKGCTEGGTPAPSDAPSEGDNGTVGTPSAGGGHSNGEDRSRRARARELGS